MPDAIPYGDQPWLIEFLKNQGFERQVVFNDGPVTIHFEGTRIFITPDDDSVGASMNLARMPPPQASEMITKLLNSPQQG